MRNFMDGGVIPAIPLALNADRSFDEKRQRRLTRYYLASGASGIAVCVHTTQFEIRQHGLMRPVLQAVMSEIDASRADILRVCGACGEVDQAVSEAKLAREMDCHAVLLSPGGLSHLSERQLLERTKAVAGVLPVIGFYLQTAVGGCALSYDYWRALCDIPNVVAIKCAAFDRYKTLSVARAVADSGRSIALYTGNDDNIVADLLTEFRFGEKKTRFVGGLLGQWSIWTHAAAELFECVRRRDNIEELLTIGAQLTDANAAIFDAKNGFAGCIAGIHEVLNRQGLLDGIWCLNVDETLSPGQVGEISRVQSAYPDLIDDAFVKAFLAADSQQ